MRPRLGTAFFFLALLVAASGLPALTGSARPLRPGREAAHASPVPAALAAAAPELPVRGRVSESDSSSSSAGANLRWCPDWLPARSDAALLALARWLPLFAPPVGPGVRHPGPAAPARAPPSSAP